MNDSENNFESLRRLLALKRYETPPPGYFESLPREVRARIRAGETGGMAHAAGLASWWSRLFRLLTTFEVKPAFVGGFASLLCLLLLFGIVYAERPEVAPLPSAQPMQIASVPLANVTPASLNALPAVETAFPVSSTNPVFTTDPSAPWFGAQPAMAQPQQVSFRLLGN